MLTLRPYQTAMIDQVRSAYQAGKRAVLLQGATGMGKTVIFAHIAQSAAKIGSKVLILVHRRELLMQGSRALRDLGLPHGLIMPGLPRTNAQVRIASVQTLTRRLDHTPAPDLLVIDEAHHAVAGSWRQVLAHWPKAWVLGVTATPARLDGRGLGTVFQSLILGPSMRDLVDGGFLAPCDVYAPPVVAELEGMHTRMGDFDRGEVRVRMDRPAITGDCVEHYTRLTPGRLAIVFCASVDHARHVADAFSAAGFPSESVDGGMGDRERDSVLQRFGEGTIRVLTSCELVAEGFDLPECEVAVLLRPTQSLTVYLQQVGRIMRPADGKGLATILDHVGNVSRFGLPDAKREWSLDAKRKKPKPPPMRRCPKCFAVFAPVAVCPSCGHVFVAQERGGPVHREGSLERIERDSDEFVAVRERMRRHAQEQGVCQSVEELVALGIKRGYASPRGWATRVWMGRRRLVTA